MLKNISNLGKALNKAEQKEINGGQFGNHGYPNCKGEIPCSSNTDCSSLGRAHCDIVVGQEHGCCVIAVQ